jgi:putative phosphoribosyl transferase
MFIDRTDAGRQLAAAVLRLALEDPVVLALPRGGVPVAAEIARALHCPLDLLLVRKIGAPTQPDLAVGAVAEGNALVINEDILASTGADAAYVAHEAERQRSEIARRRDLYLGRHPAAEVTGRSAVVVDDGIATGATMRAALQCLRQREPARIVLAVPVAARDTLAQMRPLVDDVVCLSTPDFFHAVGLHYRDFDQVADAEVVATMRAFKAAVQASV